MEVDQPTTPARPPVPAPKANQPVLVDDKGMSAWVNKMVSGRPSGEAADIELLANPSSNSSV